MSALRYPLAHNAGKPISVTFSDIDGTLVRSGCGPSACRPLHESRPGNGIAARGCCTTQSLRHWASHGRRGVSLALGQVHYPTHGTPGDPFEDDSGSVTAESVHPGFQLYTDKAGGRHKVLQLPPNSAGLQGIISLSSLIDMMNLRSRAHLTVIITGARTSTLLQRLPFLPVADAYVSENGGRIFWHDHTLPTVAPIAEDLEWRMQHGGAIGPLEQEGVAPDRRQGALWDTFRALKKAGWTLDARDYSTAFRVKQSPGHDLEDLQAAIDEVSSGLTCSMNLGMADVHPTSSGKQQAAAFLMRRVGAQPAHCRLLCDDENDLKLAAAVGRVYVVSKTHPSIAAAAAADPEKFTVATRAGILATEEMLAAVRDELGTFQLG